MKKTLFVILLFMVLTPAYTQNTPLIDYFSSKNQHNEFIRIINQYFKNEKTTIEIKDDIISVKASTSFYGQFGLINLAQICLQQEVSQWEKTIYSHFNKIKNVINQEQEFKKNTSDFEKISQYLLPRLFPKNSISDEMKENLLIFPFSDEIDIHIVYDLESSIKSVLKNEFIQWKVKKEKILAVSIHNLKKKYKMTIYPQKLHSTLDFYYVGAESLFSTSFVLLLQDEATNLIGKYGSIIGIPNRNGFLCYKINDQKVFEFIQTINSVMVGMYKEGPGSLTYNLYWYTKNTFIKIPLMQTEKGFLNIVPEQLSKLVKN